MLKESDLTDGQADAVDYITEGASTLLVADMGAGKTVVALTAAKKMLAKYRGLRRILVVSTIKVARNVWATEPALWDHLQDLDVALALGNADERNAAINSSARIVCINFENLHWLVNEHYLQNIGSCAGRYVDVPPFDGLIIDEVSKLKSNGGTNFKSLRRVIKKFSWRLTMTGTPVSEDWTGLFGEMFMTDAGAALGGSKQKYLDAHFYPTDYERRNWALLPDQDAAIMDKIDESLYHLPDYRHTLPPLKETELMVEMDSLTRVLYDAFKRDSMVALNGSVLTAPNAAALTGKLQQICQGFLYGAESGIAAKRINSEKIDALKALPVVQSSRPVVVVYWFQEDLAALCDAFPDAVRLNGPETIDAWNRGEIKILLLQPRSAGHGLNLARGGCDMVFYSQLWSNDLHKQTIARLWRRGQNNTVNVTHLLMRDTIDEIMAARVAGKEKYHTLLIKHLTSDKLR